jgi:hypothetical protein
MEVTGLASRRTGEFEEPPLTKHTRTEQDFSSTESGDEDGRTADTHITAPEGLEQGALLLYSIYQS